ncbi:UNVERIFIED_CONTAM: hypothetical protein PYX00_011422 [Menopon gallinae]|uniref:MHD domain-containing protein n=1 Tax=Menopon gallinae TaxID=328185 RepID=A0AAW2H7J1_9NEOP
MLFTSRVMLSASKSTCQASRGTADAEDLMKEFDAKREEIARKNEQIEQDVVELCKHIRERNLTSDSASLGYVASARTKACYRLAEELYSLREDVKSNVQGDMGDELCKRVDDGIYDVSVAQERLLINYMIEEMFILDEDRRVLCGDPAKIVPFPSIPVHVLDSTRMLTTLHCGKVFLGALHSSLHPMHVTQFLRVVARNLPPNLDAARVRSRYFAIVGTLQKHCISDVFLAEPESTQMLPVNIPWDTTSIFRIGARNEAFVDVLESFSAILDTNHNVIASEIAGSIVCRTSFAKMCEIRVAVSAGDVEFTGEVVSTRCGSVHTFETTGYSSSIVLARYIRRDAAPPVTLSRTEEGYELSLLAPLDMVDVLIPVPRTAYSVSVAVDQGAARHAESRSAVEWKLKDTSFPRAHMKLRMLSLEDEALHPAQISFRGSGNMSKVCVLSVRGSMKIESYAKYRVESRAYEVRMDK